MTELVIEQLLQATRAETLHIDYGATRFVPTSSLVPA